MKRADALNAIVYAGYHNDEQAALRLYIENRISYQNYRGKYREGQQRRENGQKCGCSKCNPDQKG